jgi:hypothetical protein
MFATFDYQYITKDVAAVILPPALTQYNCVKSCDWLATFDYTLRKLM